MVLCIIAFVVFAIMSIFSAKYRPLAKEGFRCVFRTLTLKPCDTGLDERIKAQVVASIMKYSPGTAKVVNRHFTLLSWIFVILSVVSLIYTAYGIYNFYYFGNCDGPTAVGACIINTITGDYGRFGAPTDLIPPTTYDGITAGNPNASIKIIEFGCFTCPYTAEAEPTIQALLRIYNGSIFYVFKPYPLPNHNDSKDAAMAVLCANQQGMQWQLRSAIFAQQGACTANGTLEIKQLAQQVGMNMTEFNSCYDNNETLPALEQYIQEGKDAQIYATPTFFVNGKPIVGPKSLADFEQAIAAANQSLGANNS